MDVSLSRGIFGFVYTEWRAFLASDSDNKTPEAFNILKSKYIPGQEDVFRRACRVDGQGNEQID